MRYDLYLAILAIFPGVTASGPSQSLDQEFYLETGFQHGSRKKNEKIENWENWEDLEILEGSSRWSIGHPIIPICDKLPWECSCQRHPDLCRLPHHSHPASGPNGLVMPIDPIDDIDAWESWGTWGIFKFLLAKFQSFRVGTNLNKGLLEFYSKSKPWPFISFMILIILIVNICYICYMGFKFTSATPLETWKCPSYFPNLIDFPHLPYDSCGETMWIMFWGINSYREKLPHATPPTQNAWNPRGHHHLLGSAFSSCSSHGDAEHCRSGNCSGALCQAFWLHRRIQVCWQPPSCREG